MPLLHEGWLKHRANGFLLCQASSTCFPGHLRGLQLELAVPLPTSLLPQQPGACPARSEARPLSFHPPSTQAPYFCPFHFCFQPTSAPQPQPVAVANWNNEAAWKNRLICTGGEDWSKETSRLAADALSSTASCCEQQFMFPACALAGGKLQAGCSLLGLPFLRAVVVVPFTACCYAPKARAQGGVHCARRFEVLKKKHQKDLPKPLSWHCRVGWW